VQEHCFSISFCVAPDEAARPPPSWLFGFFLSLLLFFRFPGRRAADNPTENFPYFRRPFDFAPLTPSILDSDSPPLGLSVARETRVSTLLKLIRVTHFSHPHPPPPPPHPSVDTDCPCCSVVAREGGGFRCWIYQRVRLDLYDSSLLISSPFPEFFAPATRRDEVLHLRTGGSYRLLRYDISLYSFPFGSLRLKSAEEIVPPVETAL